MFLEIGEWMVVLSWMVALQMSQFAVAGRRFEIACCLGRENPSKFGIYIYGTIIVGEIVLETC